jgi:hypothetical protein
LALAGFETEVGRVKEMMLLGLMSDGTERRPLTIEEPVWPVAPRMPIVGAMVGIVTACLVVLMFLVCCVCVVLCYLRAVHAPLYSVVDKAERRRGRKYLLVRLRCRNACSAELGEIHVAVVESS